MTIDPLLPAYIDSTMINSFRTCPRRFFHEFILGLRPGEISIDLHAGGAFSGALERFYANYYGPCNENIEAALRQTLPLFFKLWGDFAPSKPTPKTRENVWNALSEYVHKYDPKIDHVQPFDFAGRKTVEFSFAIPLDGPDFPRHPVSGDPFIYCGRIDLLGTYNGRTCIRDEKTTARLDSNWHQKWDLRSQFLGYCWAVSSSGFQCSTAVVRGIVLHSRSPNVFVEAVKFFGQWELDRWLEQLRRDLHKIVKCWQEGYWDYNLGDSCTMYSGCSFQDICKSEEAEKWFETYKVVRWNPLDRNPIEPEQGV